MHLKNLQLFIICCRVMFGFVFSVKVVEAGGNDDGSTRIAEFGEPIDLVGSELVCADFDFYGYPDAGLSVESYDVGDAAAGIGDFAPGRLDDLGDAVFGVGLEFE